LKSRLNEVKILRPRPGPWGRDRGQCFEDKAEPRSISWGRGQGRGQR